MVGKRGRYQGRETEDGKRERERLRNTGESREDGKEEQRNIGKTSNKEKS